MAGLNHRNRYPGAIKRALLWNPENYWQVWLIFALPIGLAWLIPWCVAGKPLFGIALGAVNAVLNGGIQSLKLKNRRDAIERAAREAKFPGERR